MLVIVVSSFGGGDGDDGGGGNGGTRSGLQTPGKSKQQGTQRKVYVVKPGDSLSAIAAKVGIPVERIQQLNPGLDQFTLQSGDRVKLR